MGLSHSSSSDDTSQSRKDASPQQADIILLDWMLIYLLPILQEWERVGPSVWSLELPYLWKNWPLMIITNERHRGYVLEQLPRLIAQLSEPIQPMSREQALQLFTDYYGTIHEYVKDPENWDKLKRTDKIQKRRTVQSVDTVDWWYEISVPDEWNSWNWGPWYHLYYGVKWVFDRNGRMISREEFELGRWFHRISNGSISSYTPGWYLQNQKYSHIWSPMQPTEVVYDSNNIPTRLKVWRIEWDRGWYQVNWAYDLPLTPNLAEWLGINAYRKYSQDEIETKEWLWLWGPDTYLKEAGIIFEDRDSLRAALIAYWERFSTCLSLEYPERSIESLNEEVPEHVQDVLDSLQWDQLHDFIDRKILLSIGTNGLKLRIDWEYLELPYPYKNTAFSITKRTDWKYKLKFDWTSYSGQHEIRMAKLLSRSRWIYSWALSMSINTSATPWIFYIPLDALAKALGLDSELEVWKENVIEKTDLVIVTANISLPQSDTSTWHDISQYHTSDKIAAWWPLSKWEEKLPWLMISINRKEGVDRYDPELREEVESLLAKYQAIIEWLQTDPGSSSG